MLFNLKIMGLAITLAKTGKGFWNTTPDLTTRKPTWLTFILDVFSFQHEETITDIPDVVNPASCSSPG